MACVRRYSNAPASDASVILWPGCIVQQMNAVNPPVSSCNSRSRVRRSTCTMMFGHIETDAERVEHLTRLRELQDETGGFTAFICWTMQPGHKMSEFPEAGAFEYLRTQAIARLYLDNVSNIQSSWVTQGAKI